MQDEKVCEHDVIISLTGDIVCRLCGVKMDKYEKNVMPPVQSAKSARKILDEIASSGQYRLKMTDYDGLPVYESDNKTLHIEIFAKKINRRKYIVKRVIERREGVDSGKVKDIKI